MSVSEKNLSAHSSFKLLCSGAVAAIAATAILLLLHSDLACAQGQEHQATAHHHFTDTEHWVEVFEAPDRDAWQKPDEVLKALNLKPGDTVADIGAGTGYFTRRFAKAVAPSGEALGLDVEAGMVEYMQADAKKLGLSDYQARVVKPDDPELQAHSMDVIFFCDSLHHVDDRVIYLKKLIPALKPDGRVVDVDFKAGTLPVGPPPAHKLAREKVISEFQEAGYKLIAEHNILPYQYFVEFAPRDVK